MLLLEMAILFLAPLFFLSVSVAGQQLLQILTLHHQDPPPQSLQSIPHSLHLYVNIPNNFSHQDLTTLTSYYQDLFRAKTSRKLLVRSPDFDYSVPSDAAAAAAPLPPLIGVTPPETQPPATGSFPPVGHGHTLPPCNAHHGGAMAAPPGETPAAAAAPVSEGVWCVAKPSVPTEKLQEAMDYACGEGGADCGPISPAGSCYFPDSVVAHASYAFNSYWQKNKNSGGSCGFGGTAMLINSDPSFLHCHFILD